MHLGDAPCLRFDWRIAATPVPPLWQMKAFNQTAAPLQVPAAIDGREA